MIIGNINSCDRYSSFHKDFGKAFELLKSLKKEQEAGGVRYGNLIGWVNVITKKDINENKESVSLEIHKKHIDIHFILDGEEKFGYSDFRNLKQSVEYNSENDCGLYKGDFNLADFRCGEFCIVFPEDAHVFSLASGDDAIVKRVVIKVEI